MQIEQLIESKRNSGEIIKDFARDKPDDPLIQYWIERKEKFKRIKKKKTRKTTA